MNAKTRRPATIPTTVWARIAGETGTHKAHVLVPSGGYAHHAAEAAAHVLQVDVEEITVIAEQGGHIDMAVTTPTQMRIPDDVKRDAKKRAEAEGMKLSSVATALLREYGAGRLDLPDPPND